MLPYRSREQVLFDSAMPVIVCRQSNFMDVWETMNAFNTRVLCLVSIYETLYAGFSFAQPENRF